MSGDNLHGEQPNIFYSEHGQRTLGNTILDTTYHIYLNDKCLFKNLDREEFEFIWDKIYRSYFKEELTYAECIEDTCLIGKTEEHSY